MSRSVLVIGAGAAGMLAAYGAAINGSHVTVYEKNRQPGLKLLLSGAGRCNLSHEASLETFIAAYFENGRFLYPAFQHFFRSELLALLAHYGVKTYTEPSGKIFPLSDRAADVRDALWSACRDAGVHFHFSEAVKELLTEPVEPSASGKTAGRISGKKTGRPAGAQRIQGIRSEQGACEADAVILTCGGASWPKTGSAGDGYRLAASVGHQVIALRPALVGLDCTDHWVKALSGMSCQAIQADLLQNGQVQGKTTGDLLWTHFGVSGPVVLRLSRAYQPGQSNRSEPDDWQLALNFLPDLREAEIYACLRQSCAQQPRSLLRNALADACFGQELHTLPRNLLASLLHLAGGHGSAELKAAQVPVSLLRRLAGLLCHLTLSISGSRGYDEAMVTAGGISLREIDPRSLMSKRVHGLYAAGEVLDIDGDTGGFNLQAAFSTGFLAGTAAANEEI